MKNKKDQFEKKNFDHKDFLEIVKFEGFKT